MTKGRKPIKLGKLLMLFANGDTKEYRTDWKNGLTISEIAEKLYGESTAHTKSKARAMLHQLRTRASAMIEQSTGMKVPFTLYSSRPEMTMENGVKIAERRYFIHSDEISLEQVHKELGIIKKGIEATQNDVKLRIKQEELKVEPHIEKKLVKIMEIMEVA